MTHKIGRPEFLARLAPTMSHLELEAVEAAYIFSKYAHRGQTRSSGERYFEHPKAVAMILIDELHVYDEKIIITALLHDVREDTFLLSDHRVRVNFGDEVADRLDLLTKQSGVNYYAGLEKADWQTLIIKLSDRLHNQRTLGSCSPAKQIRKNEETRALYLPLAQRLIVIAPSKYQASAQHLHATITDTITEPPLI